MPETTPAAVEPLPEFTIPDDGDDITCPVEGCGAPVVARETGLAWRPLSVSDSGRVLCYDDSEPSWEEAGYTCTNGHELNPPDGFDELIEYA